MDVQAAKEFLERRRVVGHHAPSLCKSIITQIFRCIFVQIASLTFSQNGGTMSTSKGKR